MRSVLIFTMYYWPEPTGIAPMTTDLADYLADNGWQVTVLTGFPQYPTWEVHEEYRGKIFQREKRGDINLVRVWVYVPERVQEGVMKTWKRIAFDTTLATSGFPAALALPRQDAIIAVCPPLQTGLASLWLKKLWQAPILYWLQDIVPDIAVSVGMMEEGALLKIGRKLEQIVYKGVDQIGIISHGFQMNLEAKGVPADKMVFLPNWANVRQFDEGPDGTQARRRYGFSDNDFVMLHTGNIGAKQCMENVIRAMKLLEGETDIHLILVSAGSQLNAVKGEVARLDAKRITFLPLLDQQSYIDLLRGADLLILNQARDVKDALIPSKLLSYLPSANPVIAAVHPESEAARFIEKAGCGLLVEPEVPEKLAETMLYLKANPDLRKQMGIRGGSFVREHYDRSILLKRFEITLNNIID